MRFLDHGVESRLRLIVAIKEQRLARGAPGHGVVHSPEGDHLHLVAMLHECAEDAGVDVCQFLISIADQTALRGRCVGGDVRTRAALSALRAVDVEFGDVDGQAVREPAGS